MKIILLDDVAKLGRRGEVRDVSDGYARNFLIPKKLALSASAGNMKNLAHIKQQANAKADRVKDDAESLRQRIEALTLEERRQASEEGKLFGSSPRRTSPSSSTSTASRSSAVASISTSPSRRSARRACRSVSIRT